MEKIYEEQQFNPKRKQFNFSVVLSFAIALFAIGSLIAVGFNQISFAASGDTLTLVQTGEFVTAETEGNSSFFAIPILKDSDGNSVFCIEYGRQTGDSYTAKEGEDLSYSDIGLSYILTLYHQDKIIKDSDFSSVTEPDDREFIKRYITQASIWLYIHDRAVSGLSPVYSGFTDTDRYQNWNDIEGILKGSNVRLTHDAPPSTSDIITEGDFYSGHIYEIVEAAKDYSLVKALKIHFASTNIDKIGDGDIYQTAAIDIQDTSLDHSLVGYYVSLAGLNGAAYAVDEDGNEIPYDRQMNVTDKFYIRVPVNKVSEASHTVTLGVQGVYDAMNLGEYFLATNQDDQKLIRITNQQLRVDVSEDVNFLVSPNTGMTTAQTIYFIGLIVLLCGVGIIYANSKPIEE